MASCPFSDPSRIWDDLANARNASGLTWSSAMNRWVVARHDDVVVALHDPDTFSSSPTVPEMPPHVLEAFAGKVPLRGTLIGHDNPTHDRLRSAVNTFFMPRRLARYESWIEAQAHALIDDFYEEGVLDLRERFTSPLPLKVISHIVGLDPDRSAFYFEALRFFSEPAPERIKPLVEFHDEIVAAIEARRDCRGDDLISHVWNLRDSGEAVMSDFEMLSLFPGLMLAGHETSANLIVMGLAHMLAQPGAYEAAQRNDKSRMRAIEECLRFEAPISGMPRRVTRAVTLGGTDLQPGDEVFLAYASGNRDEHYYSNPDAFDVTRTGSKQHIGFAQGIHACLGAPLARLLLLVEMRVLADRLPGLRFGRPYEERVYLPVREVRALVDAPFAWDVTEEGRARKGRHARPEAVGDNDHWIEAHVASRRMVAEDVVEIVLAGANGTLPGWAPGAHAEIELPGGLIRQYSLCGEPGDPCWTIAVKLEPVSRGGSRAIHALGTDDVVRVKPPRNHFALKGVGPKLFVAGGIGITPMLAMLADCIERGEEARLVYLGRSHATMAYLDRLSAWSDRVTIHSSDGGPFDLETLLAMAATDTIVYACGPERLLRAVEGLSDAHGLACRVERFAPAVHDDIANVPFEVELASTGAVLRVGADETLLAVLSNAGVYVQSTCQEGTCGTCEVEVIEGEPLHRDSVLTREERAAGDTMMVCVSRCAGRRLVLRL